MSRKVDLEGDARRVAQAIVEEAPVRVTSSFIARVLNTTNTYRVGAVRDLLIKRGIITQRGAVDYERAKSLAGERVG